MEKTIEEWLNELSEPHRTLALENYVNYYGENKPLPVHTMHDALLMAFSWVHTPQGQHYWDGVLSYYMKVK